MCGIVGRLNFSDEERISDQEIRKMLGMIRHRGPDEFGIYLDEHIGLGSARLSIVDLSTGQQPISNEEGTLWIVFNGEIYNYTELRADLEIRGHSFSTRTDTEVVLHLYEEFGPGCLEWLNGQFVIAIWDSKARDLFLARDRFGIRPLFYTKQGEELVFASEIKAILVAPGVHGYINPVALDQIFSYWSTLSPNTIFESIYELPPGHYMRIVDGNIHIDRYYEVSFPAVFANPQKTKIVGESRRPLIESEYLDEFRQRLIDSTILRLNADVPVGSYLSGGIDSSTVSAIIKKYSNRHLDTFSVAFEDSAFDESGYQRQMADYLGTNHHIVHVSSADIGQIFPEVIWHTENAHPPHFTSSTVPPIEAGQ